ncbi:MAG TPA: DUF3107 domain-containing protein [Acidimicrobiales bacterium]|nr:DUF3107 domain-containing protein [Acidimicrobiales bacterium]
MNIRIGIVQSMKELDVELADDADMAQVTKDVEKALSSESVLWLSDKRGRRVGVPASRVAYVEFASPAGERVVGFGQS